MRADRISEAEEYKIRPETYRACWGPDTSTHKKKGATDELELVGKEA